MDPTILIRNERLKAIAGVMFNLATALLVALAAKVWATSSIGLEEISWLIAMMALFFVGYKTLFLLELDV